MDNGQQFVHVEFLQFCIVGEVVLLHEGRDVRVAFPEEKFIYYLFKNYIYKNYILFIYEGQDVCLPQLSRYE